MEPETSELAQYLTRVMADRRLSQRALAVYVGVSNSTINRIMKGEDVDPETLNKLADYLSLPHATVYRMAGYLKHDPASRGLTPEVENLVRLLERLPKGEIRTKAMQAIHAMLEAMLMPGSDG